MIFQCSIAGTLICQCTSLGLELVNEIHKDASVLAKYAKVLKCILETDMENKAAVEKVILDDLGNIKEKIKDITKCQEEIIPKHILGISNTYSYWFIRFSKHC